MPPRRSTRTKKVAFHTLNLNPDDEEDAAPKPSPKPSSKAKRRGRPPKTKPRNEEDENDEEVQAIPDEDVVADADEEEEYVPAAAEPDPEESEVEADGEDDVDADADADADVDADVDAEPDTELVSDDEEEYPAEDAAPRNKNRALTAPADPNAIEPYPFSKKTTRAYEGPLKRGRKTPYIIEYMYGPIESHTELACGMLARWHRSDVLPARPVDDESGPMPTPWVKPGFEASQARRWAQWMERYKADAHPPQRQKWVEMPRESLAPYLPNPDGDLVVALGPHGAQEEVIFRKNDTKAITLNGSDLPIDDNDTSEDCGPEKAPKGWMFDVGGLVLSLAWAPFAESGPQFLALCVVPHSDQVHPNTTEREPYKGSRSHGAIQIWKFESTPTEEDEEVMAPAVEPPMLLRRLCFDWGRAKRAKWCPIPSTDGSLGLLGLLTGDGNVRVLEIAAPEPDEKETSIKFDEAMFTLSLTGENGIEATTFAWVNTNRIAIGYTDGSIALWSLHPQVLVSRHPVHSNYIIDIAPAYPSRPYLVASVPVCGLPTLVDLSCPTYESTGFVRTSITTQPNLLQWSDHLQGFFSCYPSGSVIETSISFMHHRYFPHIRRIVDVPSLLTCLAAGYHHPFLLVGLKDGSVWACNAMKKLLAMRADKPMRQKVSEHEYVPAKRFGKDKDKGEAPATRELRGAVRILEGWEPQPNNFKTRKPRKQIPMRKGTKAKKVTAKSKREADDDDEGDGDPMDIDEEQGEDREEEDTAATLKNNAKALINHEPLTRIMVMEWNPNIECACWVAVAAASGIVRVMDLATEAR